MSENLTYRPRTYLLALLIMLMHMSGIQSRIASQTQIDGVSYNYNQYLAFNGNSGLQVATGASGITSFTLQIWIRLLQNPWDARRDFYIVQFTPNAFKCYINTNQKLQCDSDSGSNLQVGAVPRLGSWYLLILKSQSGNCMLQLREQNINQLVNQDTGNSFFPFGYSSLSYSSVFIGIKKDGQNNGFFGNIRNLKLFKTYNDDSQVQKAAFLQQYPFYSMVIQMKLMDINDLRNTMDRAVGQIVGSGNNRVTQTIDYMGIWWCSNPTPLSQSFLQLGKGLSFATYSLSQNFNPSSDYSTTVQMWTLRDNTATINGDETIFLHDNVMALMAYQNDYNNMAVLGGATTQYMYTCNFPFNQWFFVTVDNCPSYYSVQIFDRLGNQICSSGFQNYGFNRQQSSTTVRVGINFKGFIKGLKYMKTLLQTKPIYNMDFSYDTSSNTIFYFLLGSIGYSSTQQNFINLSLQNKNIALAISGGSVNFVQWYYYGYGDTTTEGTLNEPLYQDGYACQRTAGQFNKLYMTSQQSYAQTTFQVANVVTAYTVEFWLKPSGQFSSTGYLFTLADNNNKNNLYMVLKQEGPNKMNCYPQFTSNLQVYMPFLDYRSDQSKWVHIACIYDGSVNQVRGVFYYNNQDLLYMQQLSAAANLPIKNYAVTLNNLGGNPQNGLQNAYYAELRIWTIARTHPQLEWYRNHQLNITAVQSLLFSYVKLYNGGFSGASEIDLADPNLSRQVTLSNTNWQSQQDLIVCPLGTFLEPGSTTCYREGILSVTITIIRQQGAFKITPFFTHYRNNYVRSNAATIYNFNWQVQQVGTIDDINDKVTFPRYLAAQATQQELVFTDSQVSNNPGKYSIQLQISDVNNFQDVQKASFNFGTLDCLNLVDRDTQSSYVTMDLDYDKAKGDIYLYFQYTSCRDYQFIPGQFQLYYDIDNVNFIGPDLDFMAGSIRIRQGVQEQFPLNDYFYIRARAGWISPSSSGIYELNLIYALRFLTKLAVKIEPDKKVVLKDQLLIMDTKNSVFVNLNDPSASKDFTVKWVCPGGLATYCSNIKSKAISIPYGQFLTSGLPFWTAITIQAVATTSVTLGSGLKTATGTIKMVWLPIDPGAQITGATSIFSRQKNTYEIQMNNLNETDISISWYISPSVPMSALLNSNNRKQFTIKENQLQEGTTYTVYSEINYKPSNTTIWTGSLQIQTQVSPQGGSVSISPQNGNAFVTQFTLFTGGWQVSQQPVKYQFYYQDANGLLRPLSPESYDLQFQTDIPPTSTIYVKVIDGNGAFSYASTGVSCDYSSDSQANTVALVGKINLVKQGSPINSYSIIQQSALVAASIDQLSANLGTSQTKESFASLTQLIKAQALRFNSFIGTEAKTYFIQASVDTFFQMSSSQFLFNISQANDMLDSLVAIQQQGSYFDYFRNDATFQKNFITIQSNVLQGIQNLFESGTILVTTKNSQITDLTHKVRKIMAAYEQYISASMVEGQAIYYQMPGFTVNIQKYSRIANLLADMIQDSSFNSTLSYTFPLGTAAQPTERQSMSVITFHSNPFLGSEFLNQTAMSNTSVYFAYRDKDGNYLGSDYVSNKINLTFQYDYVYFEFLPNITVCGYINVNDTYWENKSCSITFDRANSQVNCSCQHMSFYSVIEDYLVRPKPLPIVFLTFKNWPSFAVFAYILFIFILGVIYTYNKDNQDFRFLHDQEESQGHSMQHEDSLTLVSLAFKRKVFFMGFSDRYSFKNLYKIYIMMLHPLFQLKYKLDPQLPRFYRFLMLYTRLIIIMGACFIFLRNHPDIETLIGDQDFTFKMIKLGIYVVAGSIFLIPLPIFLYCCCQTRYHLVTQRDSKQASEEYEEAGPKGKAKGLGTDQEQIYIDPNIPIKLLFLINAVPMTQIIQKHHDKIPYASGGSRSLGKILSELDKTHKKIDDEKSRDEEQVNDIVTMRNLKSIQDSQPSYSSPRKLENESGQRAHVSQFSEEAKFEHSFSKPLSPNDVKFAIAEVADGEENIEEDDEYKEGGDRESHRSGNLHIPSHVNRDPPSQNSSADLSMNTVMFVDEKKELTQESNFWGRIVGCFIALAINVGIFGYVMYLYVNEQFYNQSSQYVWVVVFFAAQIIGFFVTNFIALAFMACFVGSCCRRNKTCLSVLMRESLTLYEDYKYVVQFTHTKMT